MFQGAIPYFAFLGLAAAAAAAGEHAGLLKLLANASLVFAAGVLWNDVRTLKRGQEKLYDLVRSLPCGVHECAHKKQRGGKE